MRVVASIVLACLVWAHPAFAEEAKKPPPPPDEFDLFGDTAQKGFQLESPDLEAQIARRRSMLHTHQILGLATLALTAATAVVGQLNYNHIYGAHADGRDTFLWPHRILGYASFASFATTATFSIFAPKPIHREESGISTVDVHRWAVIGASLGMLTQVGLGFVAGRSADAGNPTSPARLARIHQIVGWTTLGFLTTAAVVWVF